jgi:hypothetical protein
LAELDSGEELPYSNSLMLSSFYTYASSAIRPGFIRLIHYTNSMDGRNE